MVFIENILAEVFNVLTGGDEILVRSAKEKMQRVIETRHINIGDDILKQIGHFIFLVSHLLRYNLCTGISNIYVYSCINIDKCTQWGNYVHN